jgi:hypothetical protein
MKIARNSPCQSGLTADISISTVNSGSKRPHRRADGKPSRNDLRVDGIELRPIPKVAEIDVDLEDVGETRASRREVATAVVKGGPRLLFNRGPNDGAIVVDRKLTGDRHQPTNIDLNDRRIRRNSIDDRQAVDAGGQCQ